MISDRARLAAARARDGDALGALFEGHADRLSTGCARAARSSRRPRTATIALCRRTVRAPIDRDRRAWLLEGCARRPTRTGGARNLSRGAPSNEQTPGV